MEVSIHDHARLLSKASQIVDSCAFELFLSLDLLSHLFKFTSETLNFLVFFLVSFFALLASFYDMSHFLLHVLDHCMGSLYERS